MAGLKRLHERHFRIKFPIVIFFKMGLLDVAGDGYQRAIQIEIEKVSYLAVRVFPDPFFRRAS
jgi:hypothetical protein